jgi:hypothetical protein
VLAKWAPHDVTSPARSHTRDSCELKKAARLYEMSESLLLLLQPGIQVGRGNGNPMCFFIRQIKVCVSLLLMLSALSQQRKKPADPLCPCQWRRFLSLSAGRSFPPWFHSWGFRSRSHTWMESPSEKLMGACDGFIGGAHTPSSNILPRFSHQTHCKPH